MIKVINEEIKDIKATNRYKGNDKSVSDSPFKDALTVFINHISDSIDNLKEYNKLDQDQMKTKKIDNILREIDISIQNLRKIMYPNRNKKVN